MRTSTCACYNGGMEALYRQLKPRRHWAHRLVSRKHGYHRCGTNFIPGFNRWLPVPLATLLTYFVALHRQLELVNEQGLWRASYEAIDGVASVSPSSMSEKVRKVIFAWMNAVLDSSQLILDGLNGARWFRAGAAHCYSVGELGG